MKDLLIDRSAPARSGAALSRRQGMARLLAASSLACFPYARAAPALTGFYRLSGVREVAAELRLKPQGRFDFAITYGGVDTQAEGTWRQQGSELTLSADPKPVASFSLIATSTALLGSYGDDPDKPTLLVVHISSPKLGLNWSNIEITAEFTNGETRRGTTGRSGMLGFLKESAPRWKGHAVRRVGVAYPKGGVATRWFDVDPKTTRGIEVQFDPGNLVASAFDTATLWVGKEGPGSLVVKDGGIGRPGWVFLYS